MGRSDELANDLTISLGTGALRWRTTSRRPRRLAARPSRGRSRGASWARPPLGTFGLAKYRRHAQYSARRSCGGLDRESLRNIRALLWKHDPSQAVRACRRERAATKGK